MSLAANAVAASRISTCFACVDGSFMALRVLWGHTAAPRRARTARASTAPGAARLPSRPRLPLGRLCESALPGAFASNGPETKSEAGAPSAAGSRGRSPQDCWARAAPRGARRRAAPPQHAPLRVRYSGLLVLISRQASPPRPLTGSVDDETDDEPPRRRRDEDRAAPTTRLATTTAARRRRDGLVKWTVNIATRQIDTRQKCYHSFKTTYYSPHSKSSPRRRRPPPLL